MSFGQSSGPPATAKQVNELLALLQAAGHADFRDARGPLGFTQRQAAGKFTRDEAAAFIEQLQAEQDRAVPAEGEGELEQPTIPKRSSSHPAQGTSSTGRTLRGVPSELLAAELQRRGWIVVEP